MKSEKVYVAGYDTIEERLVVHELNAKPWGEHDVSLDRSSSALRHRMRVPKSYVHPTVQAALDAYLSEARARVERLKRNLQTAHEELAKSEGMIASEIVVVIRRG